MKNDDQKIVGEYKGKKIIFSHIVNPENEKETICKKKIGKNFKDRDEDYRISPDATCIDCMLGIVYKPQVENFKTHLEKSLKRNIQQVHSVLETLDLLNDEFRILRSECPFNEDTRDISNRLATSANPCCHPKNRHPGLYGNCAPSYCPLVPENWLENQHA